MSLECLRVLCGIFLKVWYFYTIGMKKAGRFNVDLCNFIKEEYNVNLGQNYKSCLRKNGLFLLTYGIWWGYGVVFIHRIKHTGIVSSIRFCPLKRVKSVLLMLFLKYIFRRFCIVLDTGIAEWQIGREHMSQRVRKSFYHYLSAVVVARYAPVFWRFTFEYVFVPELCQIFTTQFSICLRFFGFVAILIKLNRRVYCVLWTIYTNIHETA